MITTDRKLEFKKGTIIYDIGRQSADVHFARHNLPEGKGNSDRLTEISESLILREHPSQKL